MAPTSTTTATKKSSRSGKKSSRVTKTKQAKASRRGRPRGKVPAARLASLKAARDLHKERIALPPGDRVFKDKDLPGPLKPGKEEELVSRRIITRACTTKLKAYWEWIEDWCKLNMPDSPMLTEWPWKTKFIDGMEGPSYHGDGVWRSNRWMLA